MYDTGLFYAASRTSNLLPTFFFFNNTRILLNNGFVDRDGIPFGEEWVGLAYAYTIPYTLVCVVLTALGLTYVRSDGGGSTGAPSSSLAGGTGGGESTPVFQEEIVDTNEDVEANNNMNGKQRIEIPFKPVTLSFCDICYNVTASTSKEPLQLLNNICGIFRPGRMCSLMGSSGSGKTTLLDVLALRKRTGTITGQVRVNGWPQERKEFRRCSGYVEQFDVRTPELTVKETILFSARLRLDDPNLIHDDNKTQDFVDQIMVSFFAYHFSYHHDSTPL